MAATQGRLGVGPQSGGGRGAQLRLKDERSIVERSALGEEWAWAE